MLLMEETESVESGELTEFQIEGEPQGENLFAGVFLGDIQKLAKDYIGRFFINREMHCGGFIPDRLMYSDHNISMVLNTNVESGVKLAYAAMEEAELFPVCVDSQLISDDVKLVISVYHQCAKLGIPKEFASGILLMYLEFCEGIGI